MEFIFFKKENKRDRNKIYSNSCIINLFTLYS